MPRAGPFVNHFQGITLTQRAKDRAAAKAKQNAKFAEWDIENDSDFDFDDRANKRARSSSAVGGAVVIPVFGSSDEDEDLQMTAYVSPQGKGRAANQ